jgi:hypothetical protein
LNDSEQPLKTRRRLTSRYDDNRDTQYSRREIASFKESLEEIATEAREERRNIMGLVRGVDVALEEIIHEVREERDNLHIMLAELLAEIQHRNRD